MLPEDVARCFREAAAVDGLGVGFWKRPGEIEHHTYAELLDEAERFATCPSLGGQTGRSGLVPRVPILHRVVWLLARAVPVALYPPVRLGQQNGAPELPRCWWLPDALE